jgi:uncharacterized protein (TIGR00106 family)
MIKYYFIIIKIIGDLKMIVNFTIFPVGSGESLSGYVAGAFRIIEQSGLSYEHHAMGTNIEGEWDEVMSVIKQCRDEMLGSSDRIYIALTIDERENQLNRMSKKVESAKAKI